MNAECLHHEYPLLLFERIILAYVSSILKMGVSGYPFLCQFPLLHGSHHFPHDNAGRYTHIQRMFRAILRYFECQVTGIYHLLPHTFHFVSHHQRIAQMGVGVKIAQYIREWNTVWWKTCDVIQKVSAIVCLQQPAYILVWP